MCKKIEGVCQTPPELNFVEYTCDEGYGVGEDLNRPAYWFFFFLFYLTNSILVQLILIQMSWFYYFKSANLNDINDYTVTTIASSFLLEPASYLHYTVLRCWLFQNGCVYFELWFAA